MSDSTTAIQVGFGNVDSFTHMQRVAKCLSASDLVPEQFRGEKGLSNTVIALEMAQRMKASPLAIMQQIYIVHGKPSWSSQFIIACINTSGNFRPLRFDLTGPENADGRKCVAWTTESDVSIPVEVRTLAQAKERGVPVLESPPVDIAMAKAEGWYGRNGSKWKTMPELMLRYRAATLFGRLYAPEILMGMQTAEEIIEIEASEERVDPPKFERKAKEDPGVIHTTVTSYDRLKFNMEAEQITEAEVIAECQRKGVIKEGTTLVGQGEAVINEIIDGLGIIAASIRRERKGEK